MDWTVVVGTLLGGTIGLMGDTIGRILTRKQTETEHELQRRESVEQEVREAAREAALAILEAVQINSTPLLDPEGFELEEREVRERMLNLLGVLYRETPRITDGALRERLDLGEWILDMATTPGIGIEPFTSREILFVVRNNTRKAVGAWLRGEELPAMNDDWRQMELGLEIASRKWKEWIASSGIRIHPGE